MLSRLEIADLRVLVIDDDEEDFRITRDMFADVGVSPTLEWASAYSPGLKAVVEGEHDVCLVDLELGADSGLELVREARRRGVQSPMIIMTGHDNRQVDLEASRAGAHDYLPKRTLTPELLERTVRHAVERAHAIASTRELQARYRLLFDASPIPTWVMDAESFAFLEVNEAAVEQYGYSREEFLSLHARDIRPEQEQERLRQLYTAPVEVLRTHTRWQHVRRDGSIIEVEVSFREVSFGGRDAYIVLARDVTDRTRAEAALRQSEERFRELEEQTRVIFFAGDAMSGEMLYLSPAHEDIFDQPVAEVMANPQAWMARVHPDDRARVEELLRSSATSEAEFRIVRRDGTVRWIRRRASAVQDEFGRVRRIVGTNDDVTTLRRAQQYTETKSRMEAIGRLAGGVAHDFNNILTAIMGEADALAEEDLDQEARRQGALEIIASSRRAADLTRQLLAFSRQQVFDLRVLDVNALFAKMEKMLRRLLGEDVELRAELSPVLGRVRADAGQLEQVIMNLAVNARDAMPDGGLLRVETRDFEVDPATALLHEGLRPGKYVLLRVQDSGLGMSDAVKAQIFEPFFTTKGPGSGTGLGLATVHGIVKQSGGFIVVRSAPGTGATFDILLPRVDAEPDMPVVRQAGLATVRGTETILVIEDEPGVRAIVRRVLAGVGYTVIEAGSGREAIELATEFEGAIHGVVSDIVMPGMTGVQTVQAIRAIRPVARALYMSGYTERITSQQQQFEAGDSYIQKPFTPDSLARKVRDMLDAR